jgi:hypothetical protein
MENRTDRLAAAHVDLSVAVSIAFGLAAGVEAALQLEVAPGVVQRVVIEGGPRRAATSATPGPSSRGAPHTPHIA